MPPSPRRSMSTNWPSSATAGSGGGNSLPSTGQDAVAALCGTEWARSAAALRTLRRRLRALGTQGISVATATTLPIGAAVHLVGTVRPMPQSRETSHIWSYRAMTTHNVRFHVEEGHD